MLVNVLLKNNRKKLKNLIAKKIQSTLIYPKRLRKAETYRNKKEKALVNGSKKVSFIIKLTTLIAQQTRLQNLQE